MKKLRNNAVTAVYLLLKKDGKIILRHYNWVYEMIRSKKDTIW